MVDGAQEMALSGLLKREAMWERSRAKLAPPVVLPVLQGNGLVRKEALQLTWVFATFWAKPKVVASAAMSGLTLITH